MFRYTFFAVALISVLFVARFQFAQNDDAELNEALKDPVFRQLLKNNVPNALELAAEPKTLSMDQKREQMLLQIENDQQTINEAIFVFLHEAVEKQPNNTEDLEKKLAPLKFLQKEYNALAESVKKVNYSTPIQ